MGKGRSSKFQSYETPAYALQPRVVEAKTKHGVGMSIAAIAGGILALAAIGLVAHLNYATSVSGSPVAPTAVLASDWKAKDGNGISIENGGLSESDTITVSEYYSGGYTTKLRCTIDSFPVYCDGSPFSIYGLPAGTHTIELIDSGNAGTTPLSFSWIIS